MYSKVHAIFADRKGDVLFTCFGVSHICYILFFIALFFIVHMATSKKSAETKTRTVNAFINIAFAMYILDFFMMPFAYGYIDIEKLPFHACTAMCVMCFLSRRVKFLEKCKIHFALLGLVSNFVYLIYPAGVMWHAVAPVTYRVIQTLSFHGVMTVFGLLALVYEGDGLEWKKCHRNLVVLVGMTIWALIGNILYNGAAGDYSHFFNWFFVVEDPFGLFDKNAASYIMPFLNIALFFAVEMGVYAIYHAVVKLKAKRNG
ncbi:MAG: YwaF family protein [Lachnospiraceae bacterium]|nr:YwaF family protein [Lachnospiraceae bacterium]